jgi:hypothetical protein
MKKKSQKSLTNRVVVLYDFLILRLYMSVIRFSVTELKL